MGIIYNPSESASSSSLECLELSRRLIAVGTLLLHNLAVIMISMHNGDKFHTISTDQHFLLSCIKYSL